MSPDPSFYEKLIEFLNENDSFARSNGMRITKISEGYSEAEMVAGPDHVNGLGVVQGGALFTLADFCFAGAVNSFGTRAIGMSASASFLKPGRGTVFRAVTTTLHHGRRTGVFQSNVYSESGELLATFTMTGFISDHPVLGTEEP